MSRWNHAVCAACYEILQPGRKPMVMREEYRKEEFCCRCRRKTTDGIYYREDPDKMNCQGNHERVPVLGTVS